MDTELVNKEFNQEFQDRLNRIEKRTRKKARAQGYKRSGVMDYNEEKRRENRRFRLSFKGILKVLFFCWLGLLAVRAFMANEMGDIAYNERIDELRNGSQTEQLASILLERGFVSNKISEFMAQVNAQPEAEDGAVQSGETAIDGTETDGSAIEDQDPAADAGEANEKAPADDTQAPKG